MVYRIGNSLLAIEPHPNSAYQQQTHLTPTLTQRPTLSYHHPSAIILSDQHSDFEPAAKKHHYGHVMNFFMTRIQD